MVTKKGLEVNVREPDPSDAKQLMKFINPIIREPMSGLPLAKPMTLKGEEEWLNGHLKEIRKREAVILLVELDGRIAGNCHIWRSKGKHSHWAKMGIALRKDVRGMGLGEALIIKTIALAKKRMPGLLMLELSVFDYNPRAYSLYLKLGFVKVGTIPDAVKEGKKYYDEIMMVLRL